MVELTRLNDTKFTLNADLIETVEEVPDTVITLTTGKKIFVKESRQNVKNLVVLYKQEVFHKMLQFLKKSVIIQEQGGVCTEKKKFYKNSCISFVFSGQKK